MGSSTYPATLDTFDTDLDPALKLDNAGQDHTDIHEAIADALNKIEAELGVNPAQAAATVAAFLAAIPIANLADYPSDGTKVLAGDGSWATVASIGLGTMAWTPYTPATITGWATAGRMVDCSYLRIGTKTVFLNFRVDGTSNATSASFSLPALGNLHGTHISQAPVVGCDNGNYTAKELGAMIWASGGLVCTLVANSSTTGWTSSGTKTVGGQIIYELA